MRKDELLDTLRRSFDGDAWHGPAVREAMEGVSPELAAHRPPSIVHSIWETALHIAAWANEVARRLEGNSPGDPAEGDWPEMKGSWKDAAQRVREARDRVVDVVESLSEKDLEKKVGNNFTYAGIIEGLAQHNAYHAGQIMLLRRLGDV